MTLQNIVPPTIKVSAGIASNLLGQLTFADSNGVSFGLNASTITASVAAGGGIAASAGTQSVNTGTVIFSNSNNMTFGMSGSATVTASYGLSVSHWKRPDSFDATAAFATSLGNKAQGSMGSLLFQRFACPISISGSRFAILISVTDAASASTNLSVTRSYDVGLYTFTGSTANSLSTLKITQSYQSTNYASVSGVRWWSNSIGFNLTPGDYGLAVMERIMTSGAAAGGTNATFFGLSSINILGFQSMSTNMTNVFQDGMFSAATSVLPASIHMTDLLHSTASHFGQPGFALWG